MNIFEKLFLEALADSGQKFASTGRHDPYRSYNFEVAISGKKVFAKAGFQKVTGLKMDTEVIEYREGADKQQTPHKMPGLEKYDPITLVRGMSEDADMITWATMSRSANDDAFKCTVTITLKDRNGKAVKRWQAKEAWTASYDIGDLDAQSNAVLLETITVQHEGLVSVKI